MSLEAIGISGCSSKAKDFRRGSCCAGLYWTLTRLRSASDRKNGRWNGHGIHANSLQWDRNGTDGAGVKVTGTQWLSPTGIA